MLGKILFNCLYKYSGSILLFLAILPGTVLVSTELGRIILVIGVLSFILIYYYFDGNVEILNEPKIAAAVTFMTVIMLYHLKIGNFSYTYQIFYLHYTIIPLAFFLFIFPNYVQLRSFFNFLSIIGAIFVIIGLTVYIFGEYSILWITVDAWETGKDPIGLNDLVDSQLMNSIIDASPNGLGFLLFLAVIGSVYITDRYSMSRGLILLAITASGLLLTFSRQSYLITLFSVSMYILYRVYPQWKWILTTGFLSVFSVALLYLFNLVSIEFISSAVDTRRTIWDSILIATEDNRLLGVGVQEQGEIIQEYHPDGRYYTAHSAYLSFYLSTGILGISAYLFIIYYSILKSYVNNTDPVILVTMFGIILRNIVQGSYIFGNETDVLIFLACLGYIMKKGTTNPVRSQTNK